MLQKWKLIINNWINCYVDKSDQDEPNVNIKSLSKIISHLRENLNLDESKSSVLEAHTVEEFILEKYPNFKFENGTAVADSGNDIYLVASLLLFFVCVNSKDVDLKSAMCSKLSVEDQEYILRFSKSLMERSPITCRDVQSAITEACGQDMATMSQWSGSASVVETPPALRSMYGEMRRLQAALDAERFDRNYLQEELSRTNLRVEKLVKEKEKYKLDVLNLSAQMSLSRGGERDAHGAAAGAEECAKLARQLQDMELRLVRTQESLDDAVYERDSFKTKLADLKQDRDKWLALSQEESARVVQLTNELDTERRHLQSLRELVSELRQHNRLNGLDSSQLECDDLDASTRSSAHNLSACNEACVNVIEVQLSEERAKVDALKQQILTLQKESEKLHFAIEEDNNNHELIIKEKDCVIDNLEKQLKKETALLESLRNDQVVLTLSWDQYKLETRDIMQEKDNQVKQLTEQLSLLQQCYDKLESVRLEMTKTIDVLVKEVADSKKEFSTEKEELEKSLANEANKCAAVIREKETLHNQLLETKVVIGILETEKNNQCEKYKALVAEKNILEEQRNVLSSQNAAIEKTFSKQVKSIEKKLANELANTEKALRDKEFLKEKLAEVKSAKHWVEKEKKRLINEKNTLEQNIIDIRNSKEELNKQIEELTKQRDSLEQQWISEKALNEVLNDEKIMLVQELTEEKSSKHVLIKEKESLATQNKCLKHDLLTSKTINEILLSDKESVMQQKDELAKSLGVEKSAHDMMETEKNHLSLKLKELNEQYTTELNNKQTEIEKVAENVKMLHHKCQDLEELNTQISNTLSMGLDKLIQDLKKEVTGHEVLQELINVETEDVPAAYKCELLINIANTLTTEVVMRKNLEKVLKHENTALENLKQVLGEKEKQISKLQVDINILQQLLNETKTDLAKQNETHIIELDNKIKEMQLIQKENLSLTNDLNDTKVQLEVKVHSLKERLVDNENLTDKLKKTYECQIDNLNIMINKLTNYLKEKTTEFEAVKKDKDKLQQVVDENNKVIKSLEEEVKSEKLNQVKLIHDFKSERQVLKNMVTVTESVMEDQKVTLNNAISEHVKVNEILQKENKGIKEMIQNERNKFELQILDKEAAIESIHKELAVLKIEKQDVEREIKSQKEAMDKEISLLKSEIQERQNEVKNLKEENNKLEFIIQNYKDSVVLFEKKNSELKINLDSIEVDFRSKVDKLTESLQEQMEHKKELNCELKEKTDNILAMEIRLKHLEAKINTLEQEKTNLIKEKDSYLSKANEIQDLLKTNSLKDSQQIVTLKKDKAELSEKFGKLKIDYVELVEKLDTLKNNNMELMEQMDKLNKVNMELAEGIHKLKSDSTELEETVCKLKIDNAQLNDNIAESKQNNAELEGKSDTLNKNNAELIEEKNTLKQVNTELAERMNDLIKHNTELTAVINKLKIDSTEFEETARILKLENTQLIKELSQFKKANAELKDMYDTLKYNNTELVKETNTLKKDNSVTVERMAKLKIDNKALRSEIEKLKQDDAALAERFYKLEDNYIGLGKETDNLKNCNEDLKEEIGKLTVIEKELLEEIHTLNINNLKLDERCSKLIKENEELTEEIRKMKNNNFKLADKFDKLENNNTELISKMDKLKIYNSELEEVMGKLKRDNTEITEEMEKLKTGNMELENRMSTLTKENTDISECTDKLKRSNEVLKEELDKYKKENKELVNEIAKLKTDNADIVAESGKQICNNSDLLEQVVKFEKQNMKLVIEMGELKKDNIKFTEEICKLTKDKTASVEEICKLRKENSTSVAEIEALKKDKIELSEGMSKLHICNNELTDVINELRKNNTELTEVMDNLKNDNLKLVEEISKLKKEKTELSERIVKLEKDNLEFINRIVEKKTVIANLEQTIKEDEKQLEKLREDTAGEKVTLVHKCDILEDYHAKAEKELEERQKEIVTCQKEVATLQAKVELCEQESKAKDGLISKMSKEKDAIIGNVSKELVEEKKLREQCQKELQGKIATVSELMQSLSVINNEREALNILKKENQELIRAIAHRDTFVVRSQEITASHKYSGQLAEKELRELQHQVDNTSDLTHSSIESIKTINDLEKIIQDKNRTITTLQSDVTYLKTLMAESENKVLDVTKELDVSKENCHQLSTQLKKIVHQKNEELAELKRQVSKMSVTENRATQIIKVSAKYQAIILKRIAEIKSNTVLKELTNFGNSNNCDNELRRSLTAGSITMEDLENFLETTERHLKKCTEKQVALQKERDRLTEVNRINESEIVNLKKFLTELSVSFQTFSSVKELYAQKLSRVVSVQRTVRREILGLDGHVAPACTLGLERGYAAAMQDLAECAMNLERWVERSIGRTISAEKIKQAFMNDNERTSLAPTSVQNAGLEVQLDELEISFQKLLEEVSRTPRGQVGARDMPGEVATVMEVRAEYEDKLNRMKAKMKQLYTEQIAVFKEKQREEITMLERQLSRTRDKLAESSRAYEQHIRGLTTELWSVGEKFLVQKDEADWLRRKQRSGSLMSLQHVHSSGLVSAQEPSGWPSDTYSLRSLPVKNNGAKTEGRGMHMSDEEGEVFDNRCLPELAATPGAGGAGQRLSELRWRNSLCPPHLKSSYPAETQFAPVLDEHDIKAMGSLGAVGTRQQRKEVGITAYKKPGPPTPSKQAGRLSATDSELRESLRVEPDPQPSRKTSTPSRIRSLFRSSKTDTTEGTPRSRRLSNMFRKK